MSDAYIEQRDGVYVVSGTRVSLDSIVYAFLSGQSAEATPIRCSTKSSPTRRSTRR